MPSAERWTTTGLLEHFMQVHRQMADRAFAFLLGSGASKSSGIPTGGELVQQWLCELHRQLDPDAGISRVEEWATADHLGIPGFEFARAPEFYPQVFERRFGRDLEQGYAALEHVMQGAEPSIGYSILATILATERHSVVITPNFDDLVADALAIFAHPHPLVVGHESLAHFAGPRLRRPLIAKVHRDLFLEPRNSPGELRELPEAWSVALQRLFEHYTLIVMGYGGNDGGLMDLLRTVEPGKIVGGILWCYREQDGLPRQEILDLVARHSGAVVPILGFDEVMLQLNERLEYSLRGNRITELASTRRELYERSVDEIRARLSVPLPTAAGEAARLQVGQALERTLQNEFEHRADQEPDVARREQLYRTGVQQFPNSSALFNNGGLFFERRGQYDEAERLYREAYERRLYSQTVKLLINFASFLWRIRKNYTEAEQLYRLAVATQPTIPGVTLSFAAFLLAGARFLEAVEQARQTLALCGVPPYAVRPDVEAVAFYYLGLINRVTGTDDTAELASLKKLLRAGFPRYQQLPFAEITQAALERLQEDDRQLYMGLAEVLLGRKPLLDLDAHARWSAVEDS